MSNGSSQDELELVQVDPAQVVAKALLVGYGIILIGISEYFIFSCSLNNMGKRLRQSVLDQAFEFLVKIPAHKLFIIRREPNDTKMWLNI